MSWTRRRLLVEGARLGLILPVVGLASACSGAGSCVDPAQLTTSEASLRASFHFTERSPHGPEQECAACQFFTVSAAEANGCGSCQILQGPANPRGHCDSWSPRTG